MTSLLVSCNPHHGVSTIMHHCNLFSILNFCAGLCGLEAASVKRQRLRLEPEVRGWKPGQRRAPTPDGEIIRLQKSGSKTSQLRRRVVRQQVCQEAALPQVGSEEGSQDGRQGEAHPPGGGRNLHWVNRQPAPKLFPCLTISLSVFKKMNLEQFE